MNLVFGVSEVVPGLLHCVFRCQQELACTFLRFQEYYESPVFKGRIFTLDDFRTWYAGVRGSFTYYSDWSGFNVPGYVFEPFRRGDFSPMSDRERQLLRAVETWGRSQPFYVIGSTGASVDIAHEVAHGLWYLDECYRNRMRSLLERLPRQWVNHFSAQLTALQGYHQDSVEDEIHAYLLTTGAGICRHSAHIRQVRQEMISCFNAISPIRVTDDPRARQGTS